MRNHRSLLLYGLVLFEELIEQHRIHLVVTHAVRLAFFVAHHQVGIHLFYLLGDESELGYLCRINLLFVTKANRSECKERFASVVHGLDVFLKSSRGRHRAEKPTRSNVHGDPSRGCRAENASDVAGGLTCADHDRVALSVRTENLGTNKDVVTAGGSIRASVESHDRVTASGGNTPERESTNGGIATGGGAARERPTADSRVLGTSSVAEKSQRSISR